MQAKDLHLSDHELIMALDGELAPHDAVRVSGHIAGCWTCRARQHVLETAIAGWVRFEQDERIPLPASEGPRALLKARLRTLLKVEPSPWRTAFSVHRAWASAAVLFVLVAGGSLWYRAQFRRPESPSTVAVSVPNPSLTPGAAVLADRSQVCNAANVKNKDVPSNLREQVLEEYGLARQQGRYYEVDYLITPALGGADDIHNLWPQPYQNTSWNAEVKDALEDHLRRLVCSGEIDLATAQREIAMNWIDAYKKYFRTDRPLAQREQ